MRSFCRKERMSIKFFGLRGGGVFWVLGGGSADFIFMGARIFLRKVHVCRRRTNVQQLTCKIDLSSSFYYLFFSFLLLELKPLGFKRKVLGEKFWKSAKKCEKLWTILPFSCSLSLSPLDVWSESVHERFVGRISAGYWLLVALGCHRCQSRVADFFGLFLGCFLKTNAFDYHLPRKHYPIDSEKFKSGNGNKNNSTRTGVPTG